MICFALSLYRSKTQCAADYVFPLEQAAPISVIKQVVFARTKNGSHRK